MQQTATETAVAEAKNPLGTNSGDEANKNPAGSQQVEKKNSSNSFENPGSAVVSPQVDKQMKENTAPEVTGNTQS